MQSRWLPEKCTIEERRSALIADLRRTRSGPSGVADAPTVWAECRAELLAAAGSRVMPELEKLDTLMVELGRRIPEIEKANVSELEHTASLAREVGDVLRDLHRRVLREEGE